MGQPEPKIVGDTARTGFISYANAFTGDIESETNATIRHGATGPWLVLEASAGIQPSTVLALCRYNTSKRFTDLDLDELAYWFMKVFKTNIKK
jgi:hypothetical protein